MSHEERFVKRYILNPNNLSICKLDDLVYQQERVTVRQSFFYVLQVKYRRLCRIVHRHIFQMLIFFDILFYFFGKSYIGTVTGAVCNYPRLYGIANECQVSHHIQQFMTGRFICKAKLKVVEITFIFNFHFLPAKCFGKCGHFSIGNRFIHYNNGIVDITTFYKIIIQQHFQFMQENKCTAGRNFSFKITD